MTDGLGRSAMTTQVNATEWPLLLESSDLSVAQQIKDVVNQNLDASKEAWLVNSLVDFYLVSSSNNCISILVGVKEPHNKHLMDRLADTLKGPNKMQVIILLGHLVKKQPPWLHKITRHPLLSTLLKVLKSETDVPVLMGGILFVSSLLPVVAPIGPPLMKEIFDIFCKLAIFSNSREGNVPEMYLLHLRVGIYCLFLRLYGMFPCNLVTYLRTIFAKPENRKKYQECIQPLLQWVRIHPELITSNKDVESATDRWRQKEVHDIIVDCAKLSVDPVEGIREGLQCPVKSQVPTLPLSQPRRLSSGLVTTLSVEGAPEVGKTSPAVMSAYAAGQTLSPHVTTTIASEAGKGASSVLSGMDVGNFWSPSEVCGMATPPPGVTHITPGGSLLPPKSGHSASQFVSPVIQAPVSTPADTPHGHTDQPDKSESSSRFETGLKLQVKDLASLSSSTDGQSAMPPSPHLLTSDPPPGVQQLQAIKMIDFSAPPEGAEEDDEAPAVPVKKVPAPLNDISSDASLKTAQKTSSREDKLTEQSSISKEAGKKVTVQDGPHTVASLPSIIEKFNNGMDMLNPVEEDEEVRHLTGSLDSTSDESPLPPPHLPENIEMTAESVATFMRSVNRIRFNTFSVPKSKMAGGLSKVRRSNSCPTLEEDNNEVENLPTVHSESVVTQSKVCHQVNGVSEPERSVTSSIITTTSSQTGTVTIATTAVQTVTADSHDNSRTDTDSDTKAESEIPALYQNLVSVMLPYVDGDLSVTDGGRLRTDKPSLSPPELLDRQILLGSKMHHQELAKIPLPGQQDVSWTHFGDEVNLLRGQVLLLHSQLQYERHKRELHAKRNRRLLGKIVRTTALEEQHSAMMDQLRLQESEIQGLKVSQQLLQAQHKRHLDGRKVEMDHLQLQLNTVQLKKDDLEEENKILKEKLEQMTGEQTKMTKELQASSAEVFTLRRQLEAVQAKAREAEKLQQQVSHLSEELLLLGEAHQACSEEVESLAKRASSSFESNLLVDSLRAELTDRESRLASQTTQASAYRHRVLELEESVKNKEFQLAELKIMLEQTKESSKAQIQVLQERCQTERKIAQALQGELVVLQHKIAQTQKGARVPQQEEEQGEEQLVRPRSDAGLSILTMPAHPVTVVRSSTAPLTGEGTCPLATPAPEVTEVFTFSATELSPGPAFQPQGTPVLDTLDDVDAAVDIAEEAVPQDASPT